jgi:hypothetical protein
MREGDRVTPMGGLISALHALLELITMDTGFMSVPLVLKATILIFMVHSNAPLAPMVSTRIC